MSHTARVESFVMREASRTNLPVSLSTALSKTLATFASTRHV